MKLTRQAGESLSLQEKKHRGAQRRLILLTWIIYMVVYFGRSNLSVALTPLEEALGSTKAAVGLLGSVFFWAYAGGKLLNGYLGDFANNKQMVFLGTLGAGLCNLAMGLVNHLWAMLVIWGLNGFMQSMIWCNIAKMYVSWLPPERRGSASVVLSTSMMGGFLLGYGGCGLIIRYLSWEWLFIIPGITLGVTALAWQLLTKNKAGEAGFTDYSHCTDEAPGAGEGSPTQRMPLGTFLVSTGILLAVAGCLAQGSVKEGIGVWSPIMLQNIFHLSVSDASFMMLLSPAVNLVGVLLSGFLHKKTSLSAETLALLFMGAGTLAIACLPLAMGRSMVLYVVLLSIITGSLYGVNTLLLAILPFRFAHTGRMSFATGLMEACTYGVTGLASFAVGALLDGGQGWNQVILLWFALSLVSMTALWAFQRMGKRTKT